MLRHAQSGLGTIRGVTGKCASSFHLAVSRTLVTCAVHRRLESPLQENRRSHCYGLGVRWRNMDLPNSGDHPIFRSIDSERPVIYAIRGSGCNCGGWC